MRDRGLVPGLTGVVCADTRFTRLVNICCQLLPLFLTVFASLFFNRTSSCHCPFSVIGHISFPRKLGYITSFLPSLSKTSYQYLGLCLFNADKEVCFTVGTHLHRASESSNLLDISRFGQPQLTAVSIDKYISYF